MYGHPDGYRIAKQSYDPERVAVRALFRKYPNHPGVTAARDWLRDWVDSSGHGDRAQPGYLHVSRLYRYEVEPQTILVEVCAIWCYAMRNHAALPDDQRLTFALGNAMLGLAVRDRRTDTSYIVPGAAVRKAVGDHIRLNLARLFVNVTVTIEQQQQEKMDKARSMGDAFSTNHKRKAP